MAEVTRVTQAGKVLIATGDPGVRVTQAGKVLVATGEPGVLITQVGKVLVAKPPSIDPAQSTATVPLIGTVGTPTSITVQAKNNFGDDWTTGGDTVVVSVTGANTATPAVTDNEDGTYSASYTPATAGTDSIAITLNGTAISGSPYTVSVLPIAPTLTAPSNAASSTEAAPTFTWSEPSGATGYQIQISTVDTFATTVADDATLTEATYTPDALDAGLYYWRVRAKNSADAWGEYAAAFSFTVEASGGTAKTARRGIGVGVGVGL